MAKRPRNMVLEVAKALHHREELKGRMMPWDQCHAALHLVFFDRAAVAIHAMREPTGKMLRAACGAMSEGKRPTKRRVSAKAKHAIRWRSMVDAAVEGNLNLPARTRAAAGNGTSALAIRNGTCCSRRTIAG
jgi:hypothetical protein